MRKSAGRGKNIPAAEEELKNTGKPEPPGPVTGKNSGHLDFEVASCCNPIPGDEIIGFTSEGNIPIQVHRTKCLRAQELMSVFGNHLVKVNWTNHESISFLTDIKVAGIDKKGMINEITRIISNEMNLNIKSFHIDAENGLTQGSITLYVQDIGNLNEALNNLTMVEGITHVTRVD